MVLLARPEFGADGGVGVTGASSAGASSAGASSAAGASAEIYMYIMRNVFFLYQSPKVIFYKWLVKK